MLTKSQNELIDRLIEKRRPITNADLFRVINGLLDKLAHQEQRHRDDCFAGYVEGFRNGFNIGFSDRAHLAALQHLEAWKNDPDTKWLGDE